ncbi:hypothetical protein BCR44DRAFT_1495249 [Catenaria anguillulae PL171]|uniref:Uncharacterized protein n=1 Tax=Catenaria anguillulae PL171 TaxID=765915 RepID=A0A1Y2I1G4_9FUNG|nr:hypothetical protein BCR44DRAFT_1495249 [Catenaria anguillulae PL171]
MSTQIFGVGPGLAIIFVVGSIALVVCLVSSKSQHASLIQFCTISGFAAVVAILVALPRQSDDAATLDEARRTLLSLGSKNLSISTRAALLSITGIALLGVATVYLLVDCLTPVYGGATAASHMSIIST